MSPNDQFNYPELNKSPLPVEELMQKLGAAYDVSFPFTTEAVYWETPLSLDEISKKIEWMSGATSPDERYFISYFPRQDLAHSGDKAYVFLQAGIFADGMLSLEYQLVECVEPNQYKMRNFWHDCLPEQLEFVEALFHYASKTGALPPLAATWTPLELPQITPSAPSDD